MTKRRTPSAQMSAFSPLYSFFCTIYGAIQLGVPQNILICLFHAYFFGSLDTCAKTEVNQFRREFIIKDDVLKLDIPMRNALAMNKTNGFDQLSKNLPAFLLRKSMLRLFLKRCSQRYSWKILHNDIDVIVCFNHIVDFNDVGMQDHLENFYLSADSFLPLGVFDLGFFVGLYSYLAVFRFVDGHPYRGICTFTDHLSDHVISLEFHSQIRIFVRTPILFKAGRQLKSCEHFIIIIFYLQKLDVSEISVMHRGFLAIVRYNYLSFQFYLFL